MMKNHWLGKKKGEDDRRGWEGRGGIVTVNPTWKRSERYLLALSRPPFVLPSGYLPMYEEFNELVNRVNKYFGNCERLNKKIGATISRNALQECTKHISIKLDNFLAELYVSRGGGIVSAYQSVQLKFLYLQNLSKKTGDVSKYLKRAFNRAATRTE